MVQWWWATTMLEVFTPPLNIPPPATCFILHQITHMRYVDASTHSYLSNDTTLPRYGAELQGLKAKEAANSTSDPIKFSPFSCPLSHFHSPGLNSLIHTVSFAQACFYILYLQYLWKNPIPRPHQGAPMHCRQKTRHLQYYSQLGQVLVSQKSEAMY